MPKVLWNLRVFILMEFEYFHEIINFCTVFALFYLQFKSLSISIVLNSSLPTIDQNLINQKKIDDNYQMT